jgi:hypothetical protein
MKKLVLFVALAAVLGLSFVSCNSDKKSEGAVAEKSNAESAQQGGAPGDLSTESDA